LLVVKSFFTHKTKKTEPIPTRLEHSGWKRRAKL
jgi:hypothetical protein